MSCDEEEEQYLLELLVLLLLLVVLLLAQPSVLLLQGLQGAGLDGGGVFKVHAEHKKSHHVKDMCEEKAKIRWDFTKD